MFRKLDFCASEGPKVSVRLSKSDMIKTRNSGGTLAQLTSDLWPPRGFTCSLESLNNDDWSPIRSRLIRFMSSENESGSSEKNGVKLRVGEWVSWSSEDERSIAPCCSELSPIQRRLCISRSNWCWILHLRGWIRMNELFVIHILLRMTHQTLTVSKPDLRPSKRSNLTTFPTKCPRILVFHAQIIQICFCTYDH